MSKKEPEDPAVCCTRLLSVCVFLVEWINDELPSGTYSLYKQLYKQIWRPLNWCWLTHVTWGGIYKIYIFTWNYIGKQPQTLAPTPFHIPLRRKTQTDRKYLIPGSIRPSGHEEYLSLWWDIIRWCLPSFSLPKSVKLIICMIIVILLAVVSYKLWLKHRLLMYYRPMRDG